jgi:5-hydroxyisourate hydrolase
VSGRLTTHVLDTARGVPAAGIPVVLRRDGARVAEAVTGADGRTGSPLLEGDAFTPGVYELTFTVGAYFAATPGFLDEVPVRFTVADAGAHHHVPLLVSPWAYSTYRGS